MKKYLFSSVLLLVTIACLALNYTPNELIVKTINRENTFTLEANTDFTRWIKSYRVRSIKAVSETNNNGYFVIQTERDIPLSEIESRKERYPDVDFIQPNYINKFHSRTTDPYYPQQLLNLCNVPNAWAYSTGSEDIIVAVIDSGIALNHPDLTNVVYVNEGEIPNNGIDDDNNGYIDDVHGWDFADAPLLNNIALGDYIERDNDPSDENYHGTHVSGIIAAETNNGIGVAGVMWNVRLLPVRGGFMTSSGGYLQDDDVSASLIYATDMGAKVINMSWGDQNYSPIIADACQYAYDHGVILVASSGNDPGPIVSYPARLSNVISVGSVDRYKMLSSFSSYGSDLDVVAPGSQIMSTYDPESENGGYQEQSGTSMAAPHVTGIIGLLLSYKPDLNFEEVKTLLYSTSEDLGTPGFDQYFGYGLIDAEKLITTIENPYLAISYPHEEMGLSSDFDITGSIDVPDFFRYSVTYSTEQAPGQYDWYDCQTHNNSPIFYYEAVEDGFLKRFELEDELLDAEYRIRLSVQDKSGNVFNIIKHVTIDKSLPYLTDTIEYVERFNSNYKNHYIKMKYNEDVSIEVNIIDENGNDYSAFSSVADSVQYIQIPNNVPAGNIDIEVYATNRAGLTLYSGLLEDFATINNDETAITHYNVNNFSLPILATEKFVDFDGNGKNEFVSMFIENGTFGNVRIFEQNGNTFETKYQFTQKFRPLDIGNTNDIGYEVLATDQINGYVFESTEESVYPIDSYLQEIPNAIGGVFADYNGDNESNLICIVDDPDATVIKLYARQTSGFSEREVIYNPSPTDSRNIFVPNVKCTNLDGDIYPDILIADTDGDVMIFEKKPNIEDYLVWETRLNVGSCYYIDYGDYTGDGENEFVIGGYVRNQVNVNTSHFEFTIFKSDGNDSYYVLDTISLDSVGSNNSIAAYDMDGNGKEELFISVTPYLYTFEWDGEKMDAKAVHNSTDSFQINVYQQDEESDPILFCNQIQDEELISVKVTSRDYMNEPESPQGFTAVAIDETTVKLSWIQEANTSYEIYQRYNHPVYGIVEQLVGSQTESEFYDYNLTQGEDYYYAVKAINNNFPVAESYLTVWKKVIPDCLPEVISVTKVNDFFLNVEFNVPLDRYMTDIGHYTFDDADLLINSAILNEEFTVATLKLKSKLVNDSYTLYCRNIESSNGLTSEYLEFDFENTADTRPPEVVNVDVVNKKEIVLEFSEMIKSVDSNTLTIENFELVRPFNDTDNSIVSVSLDQQNVFVRFQNNLKYSTQPYKIVIHNISDFSNNLMLLQSNTVQFSLTDINDLSKLQIYPNPVYTADGINEIKFTNIPLNARGKITIYNLAGDIVYDKNIGPFYGNEVYQWNLRNNAGKKLSSGTYFYIMQMKGSTKKGKIAILN